MKNETEIKWEKERRNWAEPDSKSQPRRELKEHRSWRKPGQANQQEHIEIPKTKIKEK